MNKYRLDQLLVEKGLVSTRSQAESYIKLGLVTVEGRQEKKPGTFVNPEDKIELQVTEQYVSRAALKLASAAEPLGLDFKGKVILDVGSSTGGFTEYALSHGAKKVIAVDVGHNQLHPKLRGNSRIELHENTDIRSMERLSVQPDLILIDVSFISLREILPHVRKLISRDAQIVAMLKPQFETGSGDMHKGVIKNDRVRRQILKDFEDWLKVMFKIESKADSQIAGFKGNIERFYLLRAL